MKDNTPSVLKTSIITKKMKHFYDKTPLLEVGLACSFMNYFLTQIKSHRGLTSFIEQCGINGKWLKPLVPYDIRFSKFIKIMEIKAQHQTEEEFLKDWEKAGVFFLNYVRNDVRWKKEDG